MLLLTLCLVTLIVFSLYQGLRLSISLRQQRTRRRFATTFPRRRLVSTTAPARARKSQTEQLHEVIFQHN